MSILVENIPSSRFVDLPGLYSVDVKRLEPKSQYIYTKLTNRVVQVQYEASSVWPRGVVDSIMVCGTIDPSSILGGAATGGGILET